MSAIANRFYHNHKIFILLQKIHMLLYFSIVGLVYRGRTTMYEGFSARPRALRNGLKLLALTVNPSVDM